MTYAAQKLRDERIQRLAARARTTRKKNPPDWALAAASAVDILIRSKHGDWLFANMGTAPFVRSLAIVIELAARQSGGRRENG